MNLIGLALEHDLAILWSSMLESSVGVRQTLELAVACGQTELLDLDAPSLLSADPWRRSVGYEDGDIQAMNHPSHRLDSARILVEWAN